MSDYSLTKHRTFQWILIILVLSVATGGYFYYRSHAAQTITDNRPSFEAPLTTDLNLTRGIGSATYSRADGADRRATVTDFEGLIRPVKAGEARFEGARRVENLAPSSEGVSGWSVGTGYTLSVDNSNGVPAGVSNVVKMSAAANSSYAYHRIAAISVGGSETIHLQAVVKKGTYRYFGLRPGTGVGSVNTDLVFDLDTLTFSNTSTVTNYGYKSVGNGFYLVWCYAIQTSVAEARYASFGMPNSSGREDWAKAGTETIFVTAMQIEKTTGQANQNPSEYVSVGVRAAAPYHGANVDGVKYFATQNGNTVASNVVTEATGAAIPDATLHGYLAEGARTNLVLQSEAFNTTWNPQSASVSANSTTAPSGQQTADTLIEDTATSGRDLYQSLAITANTTSTFSAWVKRASGSRHLDLMIESSTGADYYHATFDLTNGTVGGTGVGGTGSYTSSSITSAGNGWYRVSVTGIHSTTNGSAVAVLWLSSSSTSRNSYTGDGTSGLYFWGAQVEQALFISSYIPTTTASVTRAVDNLKYIGASNFNDTAGTVSVDVTPNWSGGTGWSAWFTDDSATGRRMGIWHWSGSNNHLAVDRDANGGTRNNYDYWSSTITAGTQMRLAQRWISTPSASNSLFRDGSLRGSRTTSMTLPYDALSGIAVGGSGAYSTLKNVRAWKTAMSDTFINNLTSLTQSTSDATIKKETTKTPNNTNLAGYWSFEDGSSTKATDFSGNNDTGTLTNSPTWVDGKFGKALNFTAASSQYVNIGNVTPLKNSVFTISAWVNPTSFTGSKTIFGGGATSTPRIRVDDGNGKIDIINSNIVVMGTSTGAVTAGAWTHVAVTYDTVGNYVFYINGLPSGSGTSVQTFTFTSASFEIGRNGAANNEYFDGKIDEVRVYGSVLTQSDILKLYQQSAAAKINVTQETSTNGLVGHWSFDGKNTTWTSSTTGTTADTSGSGNTGTLTNMDRSASPIEGKIGQALKFDGSNDYVDMGSALSLKPRTSSYTASVWAKGTAIGTADAGIFCFGSQNSLAEFVCIGKVATGNMAFMVNDGNYAWNAYFATFGIAMNNNAWHLYTGVIDQTNHIIYAYLDGNLVGTGTTIPSSFDIDPNLGPMKVGLEYEAAGSNYFQGLLDDFRVYNRALSATEVSSLYNLGR